MAVDRALKFTLPSAFSPFEVFFGRKSRTQLDAVAPLIDGRIPGSELNDFVQERNRRFQEVHELSRGWNAAQKSESSQGNEQMKQRSVGEMPGVGAQLLVKEAGSKQYRDEVGKSSINYQ